MHQKNAAPTISRFILVLLPLLAASDASAIEFGSMALRSRLGAPFRASIPVMLSGSETLDASCLRSRVPDSGNSLPQLSKVRLTVEKINGQLQILIRTDGPVNDPAFLLGLSVGCGHNLERDYPVLLDPPEITPVVSPGTPAELRPAAAAGGGIWQVEPGESPQSLAESRYPGDQVLQDRMLAAMVLDNLGEFPGGVIRDLPPGTRLRLSNPQRIATTPRSRFEKAIQKALGKRPGNDRPAGSAAARGKVEQVFQVKVAGGAQEKPADGGTPQQPGKLPPPVDSDDQSAINLSLQNRLQETEAQLKQLQEIERELDKKLAAFKKTAIKPPVVPLPPSPAHDGLSPWQAGLGGGLLTAAAIGVVAWLQRRKARANATLFRRFQERNSTF